MLDLFKILNFSIIYFFRSWYNSIGIVIVNILLNKSAFERHSKKGESKFISIKLFLFLYFELLLNEWLTFFA